MKLANRAYLITLVMLTLVFSVMAQPRSDKDDRNTAPTVGTGGPIGGPTGLFTVYDGQTLRKGEFTFSAAYSNYDRDPGNVDFTTVPLSFQVGLGNYFEMFFTTEAYRGVKVNSPRNLSSFYLPNSQLFINGAYTSGPAIVLAPSGGGPAVYSNIGVFRPQGMPFTAFPYTGGDAGTYGFPPGIFSGPFFGFPAGTNAQLGQPVAGGGADLFPGVGSPYGSLLPGIVLTTQNLVNAAGLPVGTAPVSFSSAPTYVADAPFINREWGTSSFNDFNVGFKWRWNKNTSAWGHGLIGYYRWHADKATTPGSFNMMQRGSGLGTDLGDFGATYFVDARATRWANVSFNVGYLWTSKIKGRFGSSDLTILDPGDELQMAVGVDFPVNRYFQPILEFRALRYVGGRTPNALEQHPYDGLAGFRVFPSRWYGFGLAYRHNFNQQDAGFFDNNSNSSTTILPCAPGTTAGCAPANIVRTSTGIPEGLATSSNPHGVIVQFWAGYRDERAGPVTNLAPNVDSVTLSNTVITLPCPPGTRSKSNSCSDANRMIDVAVRASDPENDVLTYNYTVSGGRVVGTGANVQWDLSGAQPGTYTITTGVDDGCGVCGRTDTKTITIQECTDCEQICACPTLSVTGPAGLTSPGQTMTFTASISGDVTYDWSVSAGTIESGQGTPSIRVRTDSSLAGRNVTATVKIGGLDPNCQCITEGSETAGVASVPQSRLVDEFGRAVDDDIKARVDNFYIQLNNEPTAQGYIINYGTPAQIRARRAAIMRAINRPGTSYDVSRVTFVDGPDMGMGESTKFYIVPAGADRPTP